jgi:hypothetical protein
MPDIIDIGGVAADIVSNSLRAIYRTDGVRSQDVNLYWKTQPISPRENLILADRKREIPTERASYHVFADLSPLSNWGHPARHLFFDPENGELMHSESSLFPPLDFVNEAGSFEPLHVPKVYMAPVNAPFFLPRTAARAARRRNRPGRAHAILFSGNSDNRHVNDMEFLFRVLCDVYGYAPKDIHVLNYDGTLNYNGPPRPVGNWPGDGTPYRMATRIIGAGTRTDFDKVFAAIAKVLKPADTLLIHTNNHGGDASTYGEPWLCGYPNFALVYKTSDFGHRVASLPKCRSLIVGMEQCFSGGFMIPTIANSKAASTSFASAVPANLSSEGGPDYDPWALDWIAAFNGAYPDGGTLKHPVVNNPSTREAFDYSNAVHVPEDSPVFYDAPHGVGATQHLR